MPLLNADAIAMYARSAGFTGDGLVAAIGVALAESGGDPAIVNVNTDATRSRDRGLWQINDRWHPEVNDACAFSPGCAARAAYTISSGGRSWGAWPNTGPGSAAFARHQAAAAAAAAGGAAAPPADTAPPPDAYTNMPDELAAACKRIRELNGGPVDHDDLEGESREVYLAAIRKFSPLVDRFHRCIEGSAQTSPRNAAEMIPGPVGDAMQTIGTVSDAAVAVAKAVLDPGNWHRGLLIVGGALAVALAAYLIANDVALGGLSR